MSFVHLHCHTEYSLLDGAIKLKDLIAKTKEYNMPAAAITDHGYMYGATHFYTQAKDAEITPILGCEVYVAKDHRDKSSEISRVRHHLILLAQDNIGYKNLLRIVSKGCLDGMYYKPRVDMDILKDHNEGLIALSACIAGEIPRTLLGQNKFLQNGGDFDQAILEAKKYSSIFNDRFYLEMQSNTLPEQDRLNNLLLDLADATNLPLVATNDCHYLTKEDVEAHDVLLCIQTQAKTHEAKRMRFDATDLYYKSPDEMKASFANCPQAITNSLEIAERCSHVKLDLKSNFFPVYDLPEGMTLETEFRKLAKEGLEKRIEQHPRPESLDIPAYNERLEFELNVICEMGFPGYFLIVQDFINWAKDHGIPVGPGRGSAAGSIVAWALRITNLDPIPYNLLFERFLNIERVSMPDIDVDFCEDKRLDVVRYVADKYGADKVAQITTFGKMKAKAVVKDVGRAMDVPYKDCDFISKLIPNEPKITVQKAIDQVPEINELYSSDKSIKKLLDISMRLEGLSRHASTHAAGVVVSDKEMVEYLPLYRGKKDELVTQYDMKMVEKVGLVKFDFLGLRTMTLIQETLDNISNQGKDAPNLDTLELNDPHVFELFSRGDTDGVFQVESSGMRQYLRQLKPNCFEDIISMLALYRPGPLKSGMVDEFIKRKHGEIEVTYPLPSLEQCLKDTYGVIVYQEQVMQIAQIVAGYTLGGADLLRRAMGKKNPEAMAQERSKFLAGALKNDVDEKIANDIFDLMEKFAEYGFNKSHSAAYALITYHTAYLKTYHKVEFMSALLSSEIGNQDKILKYIASCRDMGITVLPPSVQTSISDFNPVNNAIVYGLGGVKGLGDGAIDAIIEARNEIIKEKKGKKPSDEKAYPFYSFFDFLCRVNLRKVSKKVLEALIKSGAFDCFEVSRRALLLSLELTVARAQKKNKEKESNQISLFSMLPAEESPAIPHLGIDIPVSSLTDFHTTNSNIKKISDIEEWEDESLLKFEKDALGFFLSSHPIQPFRIDFQRIDVKEIDELDDFVHDAKVRVPILVTAKKEILTKKNEKMAFLTVEDLTGHAEVIFFPRAYKECSEILNSDQPLMLVATIDRKDEKQRKTQDKNSDSNFIEEQDEEEVREVKLIGLEVMTLLDASAKCDKALVLQMPKTNLDSHALEELKELLTNYKGNTETQISFNIDDIHCQMQLGHNYCVHTSPQFFKAYTQWKYQKELAI